ncbi:MAG: hypothetical protein AAGF11_33745 [Myxococcota bacterium]
MKPCPYCQRHVAAHDTRCHFCDHPLRMTQASWPARLLGLSLCSLGIVAGVGCDGPGSDGPGSGTTTHSGNSSVTAVGNDSATETDDWGEGATYAGPDSWGTTEGDSESHWGTTTTGGDDCHVTTGTDPGTDTVDETDDWGEGATYAGPDSWGTTEGDSDWGTTGGDYSGSDGPGSDGPGSDDADAPGSEGG